MRQSSPAKPVRESLQRPKGTQDATPADVIAWQQLESTVHRVMRASGYGEIRTPILEHTELFLRGVGETTDIVNKEMYTFEKGDRSLTLRPEGTAGVVRAFIENGLSRLAKPVRLYYTGPMFRYERPQAGRLRQFHQVGVEQFGLDTPASDFELLTIAMVLLQQLGLTGLTLQLNNLGTASDRESFKHELKATLRPVLADFCPTCQTRFESNPLRILDCKVPTCQTIVKSPLLADLLAAEYASPESQAHFQQVCDMLSQVGITYTRNRQLVRGLDYYSGLVFEIAATDGQLGAQNVVCGGGRYNSLVEQLGGPQTPAVGFAFGVERLLSLLPAPTPVVVDAYVVTDNPARWHTAIENWRHVHGLTVVVDISGKGFGKQLQAADKCGARYAVIAGDAEWDSQTLALKAMQTGQQQMVPLAEVPLRLLAVD
jgi:histidyl-tRNA synthetase